MDSVAMCRSPDTCASPGHLCTAQTHHVPALAHAMPLLTTLEQRGTKQTLGCGSKSMAHRSRAEANALYSALVAPHLDQMLCLSLGSPILKGLGLVEQSQWRATKVARWTSPWHMRGVWESWASLSGKIFPMFPWFRVLKTLEIVPV